MSPEQIRRGVLSPRSDIYALGLILHELLRGTHPFDDAQAAFPGAFAILQLERNPEPLASCVPGVPTELSDIATRMVQKDPERRYASALTIAEVLADFLKRHRSGETAKTAFLEGLVTPRKGGAKSGVAETREAPPPAATNAHREPQRNKGGTERMSLGGDAPLFKFADDQPGDADKEGVFTKLLPVLRASLPPRDEALEEDSLAVVAGPRALEALRYPLGFAALKIGSSPALADLVVPHASVAPVHCGLYSVTAGVYEIVVPIGVEAVELNDQLTTRGVLRARGQLRIGDVLLELVASMDALPKARSPHTEPSVPVNVDGPAPVPLAPTEAAPAKTKPDYANGVQRAPNRRCRITASDTQLYLTANFTDADKAKLASATRHALEALSAAVDDAVKARDVVAIADALFDTNEYEARGEILGGAPVDDVFAARLRDKLDWTARANALVAEAERTHRKRTRRVGVALLAWLLLVALAFGYIFVVQRSGK